MIADALKLPDQEIIIPTAASRVYLILGPITDRIPARTCSPGRFHSVPDVVLANVNAGLLL
jgi:NADH:ubiquinone oxidoreductase subunit H